MHHVLLRSGSVTAWRRCIVARRRTGTRGARRRVFHEQC